MTEIRLFEKGTIPEWTTPGWYETRKGSAHLEEAGHRERLLYASVLVRNVAATYGVQAVVDLGAGDGGLLSTLTDLPAVLIGYDLCPDNTRSALQNRGIEVILRDVVADPISWPAQRSQVCAVATEMLEHLIDPHMFVRSIDADFLVASSPRNEVDGGAYEFHTWAWDKSGYIAMIEQGGFRVVGWEPVGMFQVVLAIRGD